MRTPVRYRWVIEPLVTNGVHRTENGAGWTPPLDVTESDEAWVIALDLPGVAPESVELTYEKDELRIAGERPAEAADGLVRRERVVGPFVRTVRLAGPVAADGIRATSSNGVLRVEVPKAEVARPKRIPVAAA